MSTAPRRRTHVDTTRSPPAAARHDSAPAHGRGHAREQRVPRLQARLVLPRLQPALLPATRGRRGLCPAGDPERFVRAYVLRTLAQWEIAPSPDLVEDLTQD